jgi:hypothetical protein
MAGFQCSVSRGGLRRVEDEQSGQTISFQCSDPTRTFDYVEHISDGTGYLYGLNGLAVNAPARCGN